MRSMILSGLPFFLGRELNSGSWKLVFWEKTTQSVDEGSQYIANSSMAMQPGHSLIGVYVVVLF